MTIAVVDADVLLYMSVCRKESISFDEVLVNWRYKKKMIRESIFADKAIMCLSTDGANFRKNEYDWYKADRKDGEPVEHLSRLKHWAFEYDSDVIGSPGGEADDWLMIEYCRLKEEGEHPVICTVDKDLRTIPCIYFNVRTCELTHISEEEAMIWMFQQFIMGDSGDCIPGIYGLGPVKSKKYLDKFKTYEEKWYGIKELWKEKKGEEDWIESFNNCVNGTFIRRRQQDLVPLDFAGMSWDDFVPKLRIYLPSDENI